MKNVVIKKCNCKHDFQDETYGKQMRIWNLTQKGVRCTVCKNEVKDKQTRHEVINETTCFRPIKKA